MMADEHFRTTLAYTKSPKTSRRTTFQDELEAAVSARASRHPAAEKSSYSDDFDDDDDDDDDDDILNELLKTRRKKMDIFKTGRTKAKINDFKLSDEVEENVRPKKVSFMKSRRRSSPVQDEQEDLVKGGRSDPVGSADSRGSFREAPEKTDRDSPGSPGPLIRKSQSESSTWRRSLSESPLPLHSENSQWESPSETAHLDTPLPLPSERGVDTVRTLTGGEEEHPQPRERSIRQRSLTGLVEEKPPRPRPRQRTTQVGSSGQDEEDGPAETPSSRAATSSVSITLSCTDRHATTMSVSSERGGSSGSDRVQCGDEQMFNTYSSSMAQRGSQDFIGSLEGTDSADVSILEQSKEEQPCRSSEHQQEGSEHTCHVTASRQSQSSLRSLERPSSSRPSSSRKSRSVCSYTAESKYLGSLKVLDQKMSLQESQTGAADSLRAAVYQDWLKKKEEKLQATLRLKKQEEKLKEEKKTEEEMSKKAEAKASYEAWKEKKQETLREKIREKQEAQRKQQKEKEEKEEKKETAKRVFEKWKQDQEDRLREQHRKQTQAEIRKKDKKEREEEERKRDCSSTFTQWTEKKKNAIQEKVREERKKEKIKEIEEKYEKEEREKTALETYEMWLKRKEFQQKREKQEKKIKAIVQDEPPPPWSPPNRTVPFGK